MDANTQKIEALDIVQIRELRDDRSVKPARLEAECHNALVFQMPENPTEAAELLYLYAECIGTDQRRWVEAASYANRAATLACKAATPNYVLLAEARVLHIGFSGPTLTQAEFKNRVDAFKREIRGWALVNEYQANQINRALDHLSCLSGLLVSKRLFTDM